MSKTATINRTHHSNSKTSVLKPPSTPKLDIKKELLGGILAGIMIGVGGVIYLAVENKIAGAFLFALGLFTICSYGFNLYTGKVGYSVDKARTGELGAYEWFLAIVWLGNLIGAGLTGILIRLTRVGLGVGGASGLIAKAQTVSASKLADSPLSIFILSVFCGLLMYVAVDLYRRKSDPTLNPSGDFGRYLGIFLGVMVFILAGFEHCVANMFYFSLAGVWGSGHTWFYMLIMTMGNSVGGVLIPLLRRS